MCEKKVNEAIEYRLGEVFDDKKNINSKIVKNYVEQAILAPNSSNLQLWGLPHHRC